MARQTELRAQLEHALRRGGQEAYGLWQTSRRELVELDLLAVDVIITPLAWVPQPVPRAYADPPPPVPTVIEAARVAAEMMQEKPPMTRADYQELGTYIARLNLFYKESGWVEE